jgi:hypothetical protein
VYTHPTRRTLGILVTLNQPYRHIGNLPASYFLTISFAAPFTAPFAAFLAAAPTGPHPSSSFWLFAGLDTSFGVAGLVVPFCFLVLVTFLRFVPIVLQHAPSSTEVLDRYRPLLAQPRELGTYERSRLPEKAGFLRRASDSNFRSSWLPALFFPVLCLSLPARLLVLSLSHFSPFVS